MHQHRNGTAPLDDLLPPHNIEAEMGVLGSMLLDNSIIDDVADVLAPGDFYRDAHQILCSAIFDLRRVGKPADSLIVADELERRGQYAAFGGDDYLTDILKGVPHAANGVYYAHIVRTKAKVRASIEVHNEGLRAAYACTTTPEEAIATIRARLDRIGAEAEEHDVPAVPWPEPPAEAAYSGVAGEVVRTIAPNTESDPVAILVQLLVAFGNLIGRTAYVAVEADRHHTNLDACMVGPSSKARKGTSWGQVRKLLSAVDEGWAEARILSGLSSGEGLIWAVRDPITKKEPIKQHGRVVDYQEVEADPGVADKRALALEAEFASPLKLLTREGNILSAVVRRAWDEGNLRTLTKNSPAVATDAHISIIGHITRDELRRLMNATEAANGFGNRFLWVCVKRSKSLPFGGLSDQVNFNPIIVRLEGAVMFARRRQRMEMDGYAKGLWFEEYDRLAEGKPGLLGAILGRAEAQVLRLSLIYALLDRADQIGRAHLESALALWRYCEDSARNIFGESLGDKDAEVALAALKANPLGLTRKEILHDVFHRNKEGKEVAAILGRLLGSGLAYFIKEPTATKPAERWFAKDHETTFTT